MVPHSLHQAGLGSAAEQKSEDSTAVCQAPDRLARPVFPVIPILSEQTSQENGPGRFSGVGPFLHKSVPSAFGPSPGVVRSLKREQIAYFCLSANPLQHCVSTAFSKMALTQA